MQAGTVTLWKRTVCRGIHAKSSFDILYTLPELKAGGNTAGFFFNILNHREEKTQRARRFFIFSLRSLHKPLLPQRLHNLKGAICVLRGCL